MSLSELDPTKKPEAPVSTRGKLFDFDPEAPLTMRSQLSVDALKNYPDVYGGWVDKAGIQQRLNLGYRFPTAEECAALKIAPNMPGDQVWTGGELVFMIASKKHVDARRREAVLKSERALQGSRSRVEEDLKRVAKDSELTGDIVTNPY